MISTFCLYEATSLIRRGVGQKRAAFAGKSAMAMAKANNDSMYKQYVKYNKLRKELKAKIQRKYGSRARSAALKKIRA